MTTKSSFCGSNDHRMNRRGFLGLSAAAGAGAFADMGGLDMLSNSAIAGPK